MQHRRRYCDGYRSCETNSSGRNAEIYGKGLNDYAYLTSNESDQIYTVVDIATIRDKRIVSTVLVARIVGQQIVIEVDHHDKQLVDALLAMFLKNKSSRVSR